MVCTSGVLYIVDLMGNVYGYMGTAMHMHGRLYVCVDVDLYGYVVLYFIP